MSAQPLCHLAELPNPGSRELKIAGASCFVVRRGQALFAYRNHCPHTGAPLNLMPDRFLDYDRQYIQCSTHGALFEMDSGQCIAGPCAGQYLDMVPCHIENGALYLREDPATDDIG
ncbi:Rieske (2Fe-2S) protein [uncultured Porticoccus sp.]|uniref:Rieske (2Fe-2S) protein n=1 Tax=uncultured Porticoccus sp. TaxID=1256050 RepID=UPI0030DA801F|tara:strand:+ start:205 stop:552 length:348 start_codon:yes stop_codon:yes gene_type:complete